MHFLKLGCFSSLVVLFSFSTSAQTLDEQLEKYWSSSANSKTKAMKAIISKGHSVNEVKAALRKGKPYSSSVKKGFLLLKQEHKSLPPHALVFIPLTYDPARKYPVRIFLHGLISNFEPDFLFKRYVDTTSTAYNNTQSILIFPTAWIFSPWWSSIQLTNVRNLLMSVKQKYNADENQVRLIGVSDGGTGSFYFVNSDVTPWSCITPFIGSLAALNSLSPRQIFINNYASKPFFIVNTGKDLTFPKKDQLPYLNLLTSTNRDAQVLWVDSAGHSMRWLDSMKDSIDSFADHHSRQPFPQELTWQTDNPKLYGRNHFLIINEVVKTKSNGNISDPNITIDQSGNRKLAFKRDSISGIVHVKRDGNTFQVQTMNVKKFTLLLSSDFVDLQLPILVYVNGQKSFEGIVESDLKTLLKWNSIDDDRSMLFESELQIKIN